MQVGAVLQQDAFHPAADADADAAPPGPRFLFPDADSMHFQDQVVGLRESIEKAVREGCVDCWAALGAAGADVDIEIIFDSETPNRTRHFVQYNMEQLSNPRFDAAYQVR